MLPWNLVWNGPETEPLRAAVSAPCSREMTVDLVQGQRKPHDKQLSATGKGSQALRAENCSGTFGTFKNFQGNDLEVWPEDTVGHCIRFSLLNLPWIGFRAYRVFR